MDYTKVRASLDTPVKTIQQRHRVDTKVGNQLYKERILLGKKTGLNQKEIGELSIEQFVHLLHFHEIDKKCDCK